METPHHPQSDMAQYAVDRMQKAGINAWRNKTPSLLLFPCPSGTRLREHCPATSGDVAHLITTAHHLDTAQIDKLIDDVIADFNLHAVAKRQVMVSTALTVRCRRRRLNRRQRSLTYTAHWDDVRKDQKHGSVPSDREIFCPSSAAGVFL